MRDVLTWSATTIATMSVLVAVWCVKLQAPELVPAQTSSVSAQGGQLATLPASWQALETCSVGEVVLIAAHPEPSQRVASVALPDGRLEQVRPGSAVAGHVVESIDLDRVVLRRGADRCALPIGDEPHVDVDASPATARATPSTRRSFSLRPGARRPSPSGQPLTL
jgi:hypothetical protein